MILNNFNSIKKIVEAEIKVDFCELIKDDSFKTILKYVLRKNLNSIDASVLLIDYTKTNYQMEL